MPSNPAQKRKRIFISSIVLSAIASLAILAQSSSANNASNAMRVLTFPTEYSVGNLGVLEDRTEVTGKGKVTPIADARGTVKVPKNKLVKLEPGVQFYQHPEFLSKLPPDGIDYIKLRFTSMTDADDKIIDRVLPYLHRLSGLQGIDLDQSETTDAGLATLGTMPELRALSLSETMVTGKSLQQLKGSKKLENIRFGKVIIDNESLRWLKEFPQLNTIDVVRTNLSMRGLGYICQCKKLEVIDLNENQAIDDRAIAMLSTLPKLRNLHVRGTKISYKGVLQLSKLRIEKFSLPQHFSLYSPAEQKQIASAFPGIKFKTKKGGVDSYTRTIFGPLSR